MLKRPKHIESFLPNLSAFLRLQCDCIKPVTLFSFYLLLLIFSVCVRKSISVVQFSDEISHRAPTFKSNLKR